MALVRRIMLLGQSPAVKAVESVVAQAARTYQGVAAAPHQPGVAHAPDAAQAAPPPPPPVQAAASAPNLAASTPAVLTAFILVAVGMIIAYEMPKRNPFQVSSAMAAYGGLLVFSAAVERLLEPFTHWLPGGRQRDVYESTVAAMLNGHPLATLDAVAHAKSQLDRSTGSRAVILWGFATAVSTVVASASGFYLLRMIAAPTWSPSVPPWIDALVTGLVVGSGTKPLHDLIIKAQATKAPAEPS